MCDCKKTANLRFLFDHATVHMAADLKVGDTVYVGYNIEGMVDSIIRVDNDTILAEGRLALSKGGSANFKLIKNGKTVDISVDEQTPLWGIKGHIRNPISKLDSML